MAERIREALLAGKEQCHACFMSVPEEDGGPQCADEQCIMSPFRDCDELIGALGALEAMANDLAANAEALYDEVRAIAAELPARGRGSIAAALRQALAHFDERDPLAIALMKKVAARRGLSG